MFQGFGEAYSTLVSFDFGNLGDGEKVQAIAAISQTVAALLSLVALLVSLWVFSRQQRLDRWQLRLAREDHIIAWTRMCLAAMAEVEEHVKTHVLQGDELLSRGEFIGFRARLSALIDEGRLYFPNVKDPVKGASKDPAFQGHRQKVLNELVAFYDQLRSIQEQPGGWMHKDAVSELNKLRRSFVSCTQTTIDPRRFNRVRA